MHHPEKSGIRLAIDDRPNNCNYGPMAHACCMSMASGHITVPEDKFNDKLRLYEIFRSFRYQDDFLMMRLDTEFLAVASHSSLIPSR